MPVEDSIISIYCYIADSYADVVTSPLRSRKFTTKLSDAEVITMEIVGEFMVAPRVGAWIETLSAKNAKRKPPIGGSHFDLDGVASPSPNPRHLMQLRFARCGRSFRPEGRCFNQQGIFD